MRINKICENCKEVFVAKTTTTKFCSTRCAQINYKLRQRKDRIANAAGTIEKNSVFVVGETKTEKKIKEDDGELITIEMLSRATNLSERTIYRLMHDSDFPRLNIGKNLRFHKETVIQYLIKKFSK